MIYILLQQRQNSILDLWEPIQQSYSGQIRFEQYQNSKKAGPSMDIFNYTTVLPQTGKLLFQYYLKYC